MSENTQIKADNNKDSSSVLVIDRAFTILELVSQNDTMSLKDIYSALGLNKASTLRIVNALTANGYFLRDEDGNYRLSYKPYEIGLRAIRRINYITFIRESLEQMARDLGAIAQFSVRDGDELLCLESFDLTDSNFSVYTNVGQRSQLYATGAGKAILSVCTDEEIRELWGRLPIKPFTPKTVTDFDTFMEKIRQVRRSGYAIDDEESELGLFCVGTSLTNAANRTIGAISLSVNHMDEEELRKLSAGLLAQKQRLSYLLSYRT